MKKINPELKQLILERLEAGSSINILVEKYGVSKTTICRWIERENTNKLKSIQDLTLSTEQVKLLANNRTIDLTSSRLLFRQFRLTDYQAVFTNWASSPQVTRYLRWDAHKTPQDSLNYLRYRLEQYCLDPNNLSWIVVLKSTNEPIGEIALVDVDRSQNWCEVGYVYGEKYWHQGYATEALLCILPYLKQLGFTNIVSSALKLNVASAKVLTKCGFTLTEETSTTQRDRLNDEETTSLNFKL